MERREAVESANDSWDAFALAAIAPLGPFAPVHLAPKLPPALLNTALVTYLQLQSDELLLGLIDGGAREGDGCCALTTRRVYWAEHDDQREPSPGGIARWRRRNRRPCLLCQSADYGELPVIIPESRVGDQFYRLDLGRGRNLPLKAADARLAQTLARFLETMGAATRTGYVPSLIDFDPQLVVRIPWVLPTVVKVTDQARNLGSDLLHFRAALETATPRVIMTPVFIAACVAVFAAMVACGVPVLWPTGTELVDWGANEGARIVLSHQYWRLFTSVFVHGGFIHLAVNMWSLLVIGPLVERLFGNWAFAVIYVAAGIGGAIASVAASPVRIGVGASGAICGILGALLAFLITHRRSIPASVLKSLRANALGVVVFMLILGAMVPNIDQEAHLGGLATGFVGGLLLSRPLPLVFSRRVALRRGVSSVLMAAALAGMAFAVARRGETKLPPAVRFQGILSQITPGLGEFNAIEQAMPPSTLNLSRNWDDPLARQQQIRSVEELTKRATANLARLRPATTPDRGLRAMVDALVDAQRSQLDELRTCRRYLETGDRELLAGPKGFLATKTVTNQNKRSFQERQMNYLSTNGLIGKPVAPAPAPTTVGKPK